MAILGLLAWLIGTALHPEADTTPAVSIGVWGFRPVAVVVPVERLAAIRATNDDTTGGLEGRGVAHEFAISELGIDVRLEPGQSSIVALPPLPPGTYHYYCGLCCGTKDGDAMQGALIVH